MTSNSLLSLLMRAIGLRRTSDFRRGTGMANQFVRMPRDRYDPDDLLKQVAQQQPRPVGGMWELELENDLCEIGITLPGASGAPDPEAKAFLVEVLRQVRTLDNLVQLSCEQECVRTGLGSENYELAISWVFVGPENLAEQTLALTYYGMCVNTEWDAKFKRDASGTWQPVNFLQPAADEKPA
ncbi:hypothetical protein [Prosthecobacter sp.]|uniref:hypothetical protein n=1 Tax=Prosthecobacter sp. TaxID=1965333 RepID=UPI003783C5FA